MVLVIVVLPLGSYLYLRIGYEYRKPALDILSNRVELPLDFKKELYDIDSLILTRESVVLQLISSDLDKKHNEYFNEQLGAQDGFYIKAFDRSSIFVQSEGFKNYFKDHSYILLSKGKECNRYKNTPKNRSDVYDHAVILLPVKKRDKVKVVR